MQTAVRRVMTGHTHTAQRGHTLSKRLLLSMKGVEIQEHQSLWARVHSCKYVSVFFFFFFFTECVFERHWQG